MFNPENAKDNEPLCGLELTPNQQMFKYVESVKKFIERKTKKPAKKVGETWYVKSAENATLIEVKILHMTEKTVQFTILPDSGHPERREWSTIKFIERVEEKTDE